MQGLYFITYTYQLWSADASEPPILTNPLLSGNNQQPHDDHYPIQNSYTPDEPLQKFNDRLVDVQFEVRAMGNDDGYHLAVTIKQGDSYDKAVVCEAPQAIPVPQPGTAPAPAKVGSTYGSKSEYITISLVAG